MQATSEQRDTADVQIILDRLVETVKSAIDQGVVKIENSRKDFIYIIDQNHTLNVKHVKEQKENLKNHLINLKNLADWNGLNSSFCFEGQENVIEYFVEDATNEIETCFRMSYEYVNRISNDAKKRIGLSGSDVNILWFITQQCLKYTNSNCLTATTSRLTTALNTIPQDILYETEQVALSISKAIDFTNYYELNILNSLNQTGMKIFNASSKCISDLIDQIY